MDLTNTLTLMNIAGALVGIFAALTVIAIVLVAKFNKNQQHK